MHHQEYLPPEPLRDTIRCFWYNRRESGDEQTSYEVQPDGFAEIIFYFGNLAGIDDKGNLQSLPSPFMMGLLNQPVTFYTQDKLEIIGIRCFPWTVFDLLGLPSGKGLRIFEHPIAQLQPGLSTLIEQGKPEKALTAVEQYFLNARLHVATDSMLSKAGAAMRSAKGTIPVSGVADAAHTTVRTLERNFKQSSGHTVKDVAALIRFEQVRNSLWTQPDINLPGLAHELGYSDQSHLSREFKRYSGTTPAAFARNAKKNKVLTEGDFVAFVQS